MDEPPAARAKASDAASVKADVASVANDWLTQQQGGVRRWLLSAMGLGAAGTVLLCVQAGLLAWALNAMLLQNANVRDVLPAAAGFVLLALVRAACAVQARRFGFEAGRRVVADVRKRVLEAFRARGPAWLARQSSADLITRTVDGVDALAPYYARYLPQKAAAVLLPLIVLVAAFPADWVAGLVMLVTAPLVPLFMVLLGGVAERASQRRWVTLLRLGNQFFDSLQGLVTLRLFGAGARRRVLLAERSEAYRRETMSVLRVAFLSSLVLEFFAMVSIAVVAVLVGFRLMWGDVAFTHGMFVLLLAPEFFLPLRALGALRHARMDAVSAAGDLAALLTRVPPGHAPVSTPSPAVDAPMHPPCIELEDVRFEYAPGRAGLDGVTLHLAAGSTTVVVGASGSGKSSLLQLLMGFHAPSRGTVRVDGHALDAFDAQAWCARIAWLPQRPHLFVGTLRDNVRLARPDADDMALERAARAAGLDAVLRDLPQGWATPLGEHGYGLSGGQAQRVALARAWLRDAPLLLLDEPTQHLDEASAHAVQQAIAELRRGRTVVQVAHRLDAARTADQVVVMAAGRVIEAGTPAQLLADRGAFFRLLQNEEAA
nr:thiol reductant ABC exporter subunit CydD [Oleiagrimonas soli]